MKLSTREMMITALFTAIMIAGAFIRIPFPLLPVTLQPVVCAMAGLLIGPRLGALSMTLYMILGLAGLPVFTGGGGITYIFNNSFGFIAGFILGAYVIGLINGARKPDGNGKAARLNSLKAVMAGLLTIYAVGISYMLLIMRVYMGNTQVGVLFAITANLPYIVKDALLFSAVALAFPPNLSRFFSTYRHN